jgi:hypothetical protein
MWWKQLLDYFGGAADSPPEDSPTWLTHPAVRGLWWGFLLLLVILFSGQTSKFIYIDF